MPSARVKLLILWKVGKDSSCHVCGKIPEQRKNDEFLSFDYLLSTISDEQNGKGHDKGGSGICLLSRLQVSVATTAAALIQATLETH